MHIVIADNLPESAAAPFLERGWTVDAKSGRTPQDLARDLARADALIVRSATQVTADLLAAAPRLRVVARAGTGVDNVDLDAASDRGVLVLNAAGANSISVAELTLGLMISLARGIAAADASMKQGAWDKKRFTGIELRGKLLGVIGFGRIGREVAARARAFGMDVVAHDPFIGSRAAESAAVPLVPLDDLLGRADFVTLHVPSLPETRHLINAERLSKCRRGIRIVNTARGELVDEAALADAIERGIVAGAAIDVFEQEPPVDRRLANLPQVVATPHIAASTREAQELVGVEVAAAVRDYLAEGVIRNAVNFPAVPVEEMPAVRPFLDAAEKLGRFVAQLAPERPQAIGIRYYGEIASRHETILGSAVLAGALSPFVDGAVTQVNARKLAADRGIEVVESRSTRPRDFVNVISVKLHGSNGERWAEATVLHPGRPRLCSLEGIDIEMPLAGTLIVIRNDDTPGVIGNVGSILGRHGVNIGSFGLGRADGSAIGVLAVDPAPGLGQAVEELKTLPSVKDVRLVALSSSAAGRV
ncbi:MAG TPA: phosphoglycerate dehydrogenase [Vicinamibacterales bacterium]|jgi:D-3-phosphoglycerate dehydrogenase|nr:phosphoglycerate dehydrogenase [Vicinamibacterales bacterium]